MTEVQEATCMMREAAECAMLDIISIASRMKQCDASMESYTHVCDLALELHAFVEQTCFLILENEVAEGSEVRGPSATSAQ